MRLEQLQDALIDAFDRDTLDRVVYYAVQERLEKIVAPGSLKSQVFNLLMWANENNKVAAIVREARKESPGNVALRQFEEYAQAKWPGTCLSLDVRTNGITESGCLL